SRRRHTRSKRDWSSDVCSSDLAFIIPYSIFSSQNVAESLKAYVGESVLKERVRIAEFNQSLHDEKWRVKLPGKFQEDLAVFNSRSEERRVGKECRSRRST